MARGMGKLRKTAAVVMARRTLSRRESVSSALVVVVVVVGDKRSESAEIRGKALLTRLGKGFQQTNGVDELRHHQHTKYGHCCSLCIDDVIQFSFLRKKRNLKKVLGGVVSLAFVSIAIPLLSLRKLPNEADAPLQHKRALFLHSSTHL